MKTNLVKAVAVLALWIGASDAAAQEASPLGSPPGPVRYSKDYAATVREALPPVDAGMLEKALEKLRGAPAPGAAAIGSTAELEKFFGFQPTERSEDREFLVAGDAAYQYYAKAGRVYVAWKLPPSAPYGREEFKAGIPAVRKAHAELAARLGVPRDQVFFVDFRELLSQTDGHPVAQPDSTGPIQVEGAMSTMLRAVGGIQVDGSLLRVGSVDASRLSLVDLRWSPVRLADATRNGLRAPADLADAIARRLETTSNGLPVHIRMAVVLRPVETDGVTAYVPALKVGVRPQSIGSRAGFRTDAGEVFYSDLVKGSPLFVEPPGKETEGSER
jgi:hypothetical protein